MMDSLFHQWQYVPSIRGCLLFQHNSMYNIQGGVHCLTSDSRNNLWGRVCCVTSNSLCVLSWWCHCSMQRVGLRSSLLYHGLNHGWRAVLCQCQWLSTATLMSRLQTIQHYSHFLFGTSDFWEHMLKDCGIYKCTVPVLSAKKATLDNYVLQKLQHLKQLNFLNIVTVHVVSVMYVGRFHHFIGHKGP
jgi:hypothetical protein